MIEKKLVLIKEQLFETHTGDLAQLPYEFAKFPEIEVRFQRINAHTAPLLGDPMSIEFFRKEGYSF